MSKTLARFVFDRLPPNLRVHVLRFEIESGEVIFQLEAYCYSPGFSSCRAPARRSEKLCLLACYSAFKPVAVLAPV
jgi:hypothetical protein